ncbi:hypothetical protein TNCV_2603671 [Trichonephila clavipes]|nr:hypothetical protein TNCV_2603671 [Trichonephila clavipes]
MVTNLTINHSTFLVHDMAIGFRTTYVLLGISDGMLRSRMVLRITLMNPLIAYSGDSHWIPPYSRSIEEKYTVDYVWHDSSVFNIRIGF